MHYVREDTERYGDACSMIFVSMTRHYVIRRTENSRQKINDTKNYVITYVKLQSSKLINKKNSLLILDRRCVHEKSTQKVMYASEKINGIRNQSRLNIIDIKIKLVQKKFTGILMGVKLLYQLILQENVPVPVPYCRTSGMVC